MIGLPLQGRLSHLISMSTTQYTYAHINKYMNACALMNICVHTDGFCSKGCLVIGLVPRCFGQERGSARVQDLGIPGCVRSPVGPRNSDHCRAGRTVSPHGHSHSVLGWVFSIDPPCVSHSILLVLSGKTSPRVCQANLLMEGSSLGLFIP